MFTSLSATNYTVYTIIHFNDSKYQVLEHISTVKVNLFT